MVDINVLCQLNSVRLSFVAIVSVKDARSDDSNCIGHSQKLSEAEDFPEVPEECYHPRLVS